MRRMDLSPEDRPITRGRRPPTSQRSEQSCPNLMRRALQTHNDGQMPHVTSLVDGQSMDADESMQWLFRWSALGRKGASDETRWGSGLSKEEKEWSF